MVRQLQLQIFFAGAESNFNLCRGIVRQRYGGQLGLLASVVLRRKRTDTQQTHGHAERQQQSEELLQLLSCHFFVLLSKT